MFAYHFDRRCNLSINQTLECFDNFDLENILKNYNNSLSHHGILYLTKNLYGDAHVDNSSFLWEIAIEYVRLMKYPHYPSRFNCLFAVESLEELDAWKHILNYSNYQIVKLECSKYYKFDAKWITKPGIFHNYCSSDKFESTSFSAYCYFADKYWSQQISSSPLWEVLVELPCKCVEVLHR